MLDFSFARAVIDAVSGTAGTAVFSFWLFDGDNAVQEGQPRRCNKTFLGNDNHDMGRFAMFVKQANPGASADELLKKARDAGICHAADAARCPDSLLWRRAGLHCPAERPKLARRI